jgi:hypothetical protein
VLCDLRLNLGGEILKTEIAHGGQPRSAARPHALAYARTSPEGDSLPGCGEVGASPLRLVVVSRFMHRAMLDRVVRTLPFHCPPPQNKWPPFRT